MKVLMRLPGARASVERRTFALRIKDLGGRELHIRPWTQDLATVVHAFLDGQHLPPPNIGRRDLHRICELGANVGSSIAALAALYPEAELLGIEPDAANAALARANLAAFGPRCRIVQAAVWDSNTELVIGGEATDALTVRPAREKDPPQLPRVQALTLDELLHRHMPGGEIDFLHVCIEGTEPRILTAGGAWPERVRSLRVELYPHSGFGGPECVEALERLGYEAWYEPEDEVSLGYGFGIR